LKQVTNSDYLLEKADSLIFPYRLAKAKLAAWAEMLNSSQDVFRTKLAIWQKQVLEIQKEPVISLGHSQVCGMLGHIKTTPTL
jgi:hypothetical protein